MNLLTLPDSLSLITAPMINQSDLPFRLLTRRHGATLTYTQMLEPHKLLNDRDYLDFHLRDLQFCRDGYDDLGILGRPVVVQLCGNDPEIVVKAGKQVQGLCDAIDMNLGCPQDHAREGHYGAYLLGQKDWPLIEQIVSQLSHSLSVPISAKLRLCSPSALTSELGTRIAASGASWITLHARHVNARRRRAGSADLGAVKALKDTLGGRHAGVKVVSNGNVGTWDHIVRNREETGADGMMVGESILGNPCIFENKTPDPVLISLEYLDLCKRYPETVTIANIRTHVRHFVEYQCARRPWYPHFRTALNHSETIEEIEALLRGRVVRWRGKAGVVIRSEDGRPDDDRGNEKSGENDDLFLIR